MFIFASSLGCAGGKNRSPAQLTVLTYNIHHGEGTDKQLNLGRIAGVIRASGADFVALQEVDKDTKRSGGVDQVAELARMTGMHPAYGRAMNYDGGQYGNAVLSRWPITSVRVSALPWTEGDRREPRCAVSATAKPPGRGAAVEVVSTHLDHTRDSVDRLAQAKAINSEWAAGVAARPIILAGDFNCQPGSAPMEALGRSWRLVSGTNTAAPTCCGDKPTVKIDHVFVNPSGPWRVIDQRVLDEPIASDHRPVLVKLQLRQ